MAFIDFTNGEVLTADQMDTVMRQSVMKFADATARDTALSAVLAEGMMCYLDDTDEVLKYDGSSWIDISGDITGVTAGVAMTGGGASGNVTLNVDTSAVGSAIGIDTKQDDVITTQGDLIIGDASGDPVRLPVGSADQVLTSDGTTVSFQDAGGGGLYSNVIASGTVSSTISITSIPGTFKDLILVVRDFAPTSFCFLRFNSSSSSGDYGEARIQSNFNSVQSSGTSGVSILITTGPTTSATTRVNVFDYAVAGMRRIVQTQTADQKSPYAIGSFSSYNLSTSITSLTIGNAGSNGTYELYGVN